MLKQLVASEQGHALFLHEAAPKSGEVTFWSIEVDGVQVVSGTNGVADTYHRLTHG